MLRAEPASADGAGAAAPVAGACAWANGWRCPSTGSTVWRPGSMKGPALFESPTTTVLVREGERVSVTPHGWLDIPLG